MQLTVVFLEKLRASLERAFPTGCAFEIVM